VWKVVPTLTSKSAEIYLSMASAKQPDDTDLSWFRTGPYVQQWRARGTVLHCTVVLAEGGAKSKAGEEAEPLGPRGFSIEASANIAVKAESMRMSVIRRPPTARGLPLIL
jgi:hypothetical protein